MTSLAATLSIRPNSGHRGALHGLPMLIDQYNVELHNLVELRNKDFETAQSREN